MPDWFHPDRFWPLCVNSGQPLKAATIEEVQSYWDRQPCGVRHRNPTEQRYFVQPHIPRFAQFERWKGKRVLEIGCGIGTDTLEFLKAGADVVPLDLSAHSVEIASRRCPNIEFHIADAEDWLPEGPFDLIYSFGVLHHTPHPKEVLLNAHDELADDGELRIMLYARWSLKNLLRIQPEAQAGCPIVRWYSGRGARRLLDSCGFYVLSIQKAHIFPYRIRDYIAHQFVKHWFWRLIPETWLAPFLGHHLLIVAKKKENECPYQPGNASSATRSSVSGNGCASMA